MNYHFPSAQDARLQLIYDRHAALYDSDKQLTDKTQPLRIEVIMRRPRSNTLAYEKLLYQYMGLRLQTLLGLVEPHGVFKATIQFDLELWKELAVYGGWCITVTADEKTMEVSNEHLVPLED